jgi:sterol desaturase/sphingolipid hydroxylase (fatty acid hydroxylase superfamily)
MLRFVHAGVDSIVRMSATRTNYWLELVVDVALGLGLIYAGLKAEADRPVLALLTIVFGLFAFSFIEYCFHRWLFHGPVPLFEQGHDAHHRHPLGYDSLPFFLPPVVLLGLTGVFALAIPMASACLMGGSIAFGYIIYGLSHFTIHHTRFRNPVVRRWAARHHIHHHHPGHNFGVTTSLWDVVLRTRYVSSQKKPGTH